MTKNEKTLKNLCETRWVERVESVKTFLALLRSVQTALITIAKAEKSEPIFDQIVSIRNCIETPNFLVALLTVKKLMLSVEILSKILQTKTLDIDTALNSVKLVIENVKNSIDKHAIFENLFSKASELASRISFAMKRNRNKDLDSNSPSSTKELYRKFVFLPVMNAFLLDFETRLTKRENSMALIFKFFPQHHEDLTEKDIYDIASSFGDFLEFGQDKLEKEIEILKSLYRSKAFDNLSIFEIYNNLPKFLTTIKQLFEIALTLPVSNATEERSFSALKRIKSWLKNRVSDSRLSSIALVHINRHIKLPTSDIIDKFAKTKSKKSDFII